MTTSHHEESIMTFRSFVAAAVVALAPVAAQAQKEVVTGPGINNSATLSAGVKVGDLLYLSGQTPARGDSTIEGQTKSALEKMNPILAAAGTSKEKIVKCTVFLIDVKDFAGMNKAYSDFFGAQPPARSTVVVAALVVPGGKLEVECIASLK
jgi:2-iminobutanoate/2-iminopropanoate deaminase